MADPTTPSAAPQPPTVVPGVPAAMDAGQESGDGRAGRGRLKIFFGMAPGVGKTYAMLAAAQRLASQGVDVVVGLVETHGRSETEQLLLGLDVLPRREVGYAGAPLPHGGPERCAGAPAVTLREFDADAAIARRPDILLVDELAHTNAPGSAREKRWRDVEECLRAGVNVYTTLNVQHLESLNDVVVQITGVAVRETVPDSVFDRADEIELVDLPVEVLHDRLKAGKVYLAENARRAVDPADGFFRRGNLTALRELALRRTAAWVDSDLRRYKQDRGIRAVWPVGERILVAVSPSPMSGKLVRAAKRMAAGLHAELLAVFIETPRTADLPPADRERLAANLRLAESLGAVTATIPGDDAARELIAFARARNVGRIVVGKTERPRWREALFGSFIGNLIRESGDIDIYVVRGDEPALESDRDAAEADSGPPPPPGSTAFRYAVPIVLIAGVTGFGRVAFNNLDPANVAMVYLAAVVAAALWAGRGPALLASALGVAAFDFFFVPPRLTFSVSDVQYLVTFGVMIAVGLLTGTLASRSRDQTARARERERRTAALYALARELSTASDARAVAAIGTRHAHDTFRADAVVAGGAAAPTREGIDVLAHSGSPDWFDDRERAVAQWAFDHRQAAGAGARRLPGSAGRFLPLLGAGGRVGVLGLRLRIAGDGRTSAAVLPAESQQLLDAIASQIASALERVTLGEARQAARLEAERERLRSALLSSVSHDLRTPLASITGAASTLEQPGLDPATRAALLGAIVKESARLSDLIANLMFATRLEAGSVTPNLEWTTVEEMVGVGLARHRDELAARPFRVLLAPDLPMIRVDNAMLPQVIHNLVENALRYTPAGTPILVSARLTDRRLIFSVADEGPGLAQDEAARVFERFYRGRASRGAPADQPRQARGGGMGLGLTICEGIVQAHRGRIWAEPNQPKGVAFLFSLPVEHPQPPLPRELVAEAPGARAQEVR